MSLPHVHVHMFLVPLYVCNVNVEAGVNAWIRGFDDVMLIYRFMTGLKISTSLLKKMRMKCPTPVSQTCFSELEGDW